jgi:hypothetical protein
MVASSSPDEGGGREGEAILSSESSVSCLRGWRIVERPRLSRRRLAEEGERDDGGVRTGGMWPEGEEGGGGRPV